MTLMQHKLKQKAVVIVDDNSENATILEMLLSMGTAYIPLTYHDAQEVLANLDEIKQSHPVLFLVDYVLPKISGMALCERLHAIEEFKTVPTVLVSAFAEDALRQEAGRKGITIVQKPYDIDVLLSVISLQVS
jgi:two-component system, OmpR family, phosphate regulon response regulator PhoB